MARPMSRTPRPQVEADLRKVATLCLEKRGEDLVALDVRPLVDYMDFLLLVTGRSARQTRAIADWVIQKMKREGHVPLSRSGMDIGSWICLDYVDFVVHIFDPETREHYDLELLWGDAERFDLDIDESQIEVDDIQPIEPENTLVTSDHESEDDNA